MDNRVPTLLQINVSVNDGSNGTIAEEIGQLAIEKGWRSYIAYGRKALASQSELIRIGNKCDIYWHGFESRFLDNHGLASKNATTSFIKAIDRIKPDIIHLHNIHGYFLNYKILFEYLTNTTIPIVWTLHDCWAITGHCAHFVNLGCENWKTQCGNCPQKHAYPKSLFFDRSKTNYDLKKKLFTSLKSMTVVSVSKWLKEVVDKSFLAKYPSVVIYNGVDTDIFKFHENGLRKKYGLENKFVLLGVASTWSASKGLLDYCKLGECLTDKYQIVLVGLSDKQIKNLPLNIIGLKRTDNVQDLVDLYSMADVVMNLSYAETFGLTTVEGLACGTPGIVYNSTASPELITDETGFVVETGDINGVVNAIKTIFNNGKIFYSKACRQRAINFFNKDYQYRNYIDLYNELLK